MPILIDGHNLIGRMADLSLDDPDDLVRLVERLRRYHARTGKRVMVFFDRGLPGGVSRQLSRHGVKVLFASGVDSADTMILRRLRAYRNPVELTVVSSDQALIAEAEAIGARVVRSEDFIPQLHPAPQDSAPAKPAPSEADVAYWQRMWDDASNHR